MKSIVSCRRFAFWSIISIVLLPAVTILAFLIHPINDKILYLLPFCILIDALRFPTYRRTFCRVKIDENGISNRYLHFDWDRSLDYIIFTARAYKGTKADIIAFGDLSSRQYSRMNPKRTIYLEYNKKTVDLIRKYAGEKSPV